MLLAIALALPAGTARESFAVPALVRLEAATALRSHSDAPSRPQASILARGSRGEAPRGSLNLAVALHARGGPGIVLTSVAYDAGIINRAFYATGILLAVPRSLAAGSGLEHVTASGRPLREGDIA